MAIAHELFRFVTTRPPDRVLLSRINSRLIRDRRRADDKSQLGMLFGAGSYESQLTKANQYAASAAFVPAEDANLAQLEPAIGYFRRALEPGVELTVLVSDMPPVPALAGLLKPDPSTKLIESTDALLARVWDSHYAETVRGFDRYVTTNYLVDVLRVYHICRLLWLSHKVRLKGWAGGTFDEYHVLIDLDAATSRSSGGGTPAAPPSSDNVSFEQIDSIRKLSKDIADVERAAGQIASLQKADDVRLEESAHGSRMFLSASASQVMRTEPAMKSIDVAATPVDELQQQLGRKRQSLSVQRESELARIAAPVDAAEVDALVGATLSTRVPVAGAPVSLSALTSPRGSFRVPLSVGDIKPPTVGDLVLVEQELRRYELGELAQIESIMIGERREHTLKSLARTSSTTTTETSEEKEESSSLTTDERFQLSSQAQKTAAESFGIQTGVNVSGKFGPVQIGASVNASYNTSNSTSDSTSQDYAKTVTETAAKSVRNSIKETSSVTVLTETQDNSLRGFNNEKGTQHVNGLYRWVDKIYAARTLNYGRRLMLSLAVPEPAGFYRSLLEQDEAALMKGMTKPVPPSRVNTANGLPLEGKSGPAFNSYRDISDSNYAHFAALYDVQVSPPPADLITGTKAIAVPTAMQAGKVQTHSAEGSELNYVAADNTLTVDANYQLTQVGVFVPRGGLNSFGQFADNMKLGENNDTNRILVGIGGKSFYFHTVGRGSDGRDVDTNFNELIEVTADDAVAGVVQPSLAVTISADFEGILTLNVLYTAKLRPAALNAWKSSTYAAIVKGYNTKKQAYDQSLAAAQAKAASGTTAQTFNLRGDQYRASELTELKRGCIDLMTAGTATGYSSITFANDGTPRIVFDESEGNLLNRWRSPLANGTVAEFFELAFEWDETTYQFWPYYWGGKHRWKELAQASGADPVFEQFLKAGSASVVVPVRPGFERPVMYFLKTGLIWGGGYLSLFTSPDILDVYADVELGLQLEPAEQIGQSWEVRLPTSMVMLQQGDELPTFPEAAATTTAAPSVELVPDESVPF